MKPRCQLYLDVGVLYITQYANTTDKNEIRFVEELIKFNEASMVLHT